MKLRPATEQDLLELTTWFSNETDVKTWAGPSIRFPFKLKQLKSDLQWDVAKSFSLVDKNENLLGFAQAFNRFGCNHLGRIVICPRLRGKKLGHKLMAALIDTTAMKGVNFSLFVYEDNVPAKTLYDNLGFIVQPIPEGCPEIEGCVFMVKKPKQTFF